MGRRLGRGSPGMIFSFLGMFVANYGFIFLKSFQQRNVAYNNHIWIVPTSVIMAAAEVFIIAKIAVLGFDWVAVVVLGLGGGLGSLSATIIHRRYLSNGRGL